MNLQILSAGLGLRLRPVTDFIPKPALPILNVPMLFWSYHYFEKENLNTIVVNGFHLQDILKRKIESYSNSFHFISDGTELLGTGGGIANARPDLEGDGSFWVINGDALFLSDDNFIPRAEKIHRDTQAICTLVVVDHEEVGKKFGGIWVDSENRVLDLGKNRPQDATCGYHFTGFRLLSDEIFKYLKHEPTELFDALRLAMKDGHRISIYKTHGEFFETGNIPDYLFATQTLLKYLKQKKYEQFLKGILDKYSPASKLNDFSMLLKMQDAGLIENCFFDEKIKIFEDVQFEGFSVIGKNCEVGEGSLIKNSVILENSVVPPNTEVLNQIYCKPL